MIIMAFATILCTALLHEPAHAQPVGGQTEEAAAQQATEFSARHRRDRRAHRRYYRSYAADPSFGNYRAYRAEQRRGRCLVDLGYGRFWYCN
jgi:hypothetical protein